MTEQIAQKFQHLQLDARVLKQLAKRDIQRPTQIQSSAIPLILQGKDVIAGSDTGSGKTLAFVLPLIQCLINRQQTATDTNSSITHLILVPTRELAQQVLKVLQDFADVFEPELSVSASLVVGGRSYAEQAEQLTTGAQFLIATPGRLLDLLKNRGLSLASVQTLVLDEADRMLDMGFKDELNAIIRTLPKERQTLLFSATLDEAVFRFSNASQSSPRLIELKSRNATKADITQKVYLVDEEKKQALLRHLIGKSNWSQALIFVRNKQDADRLVEALAQEQASVAALHGDKSQAQREKTIAAFQAGELKLLIATDLAARGLDIEALPVVINYQLPHNPEDYVHRVGRTGRAGMAGLALSLVTSQDEALLNKIEKATDERLLQQWYPGFEPDLNRITPEPAKTSLRKGGKGRGRKRGKF